jgi:pimeloyl-ACP methyl ester carboxylesterase
MAVTAFFGHNRIHRVSMMRTSRRWPASFRAMRRVERSVASLFGRIGSRSIAERLREEADFFLASTLSARPGERASARHSRVALRTIRVRTCQIDKKWSAGHHRTLLEPDAGPNILADNANRLRTPTNQNGVPPATIEAHLSVIPNPQAMEAVLAWYRARGVRHQPVGPTKVPTLLFWGDQDDTVRRAAAGGQASSSPRHASSPLGRCLLQCRRPST